MSTGRTGGLVYWEPGRFTSCPGGVVTFPYPVHNSKPCITDGVIPHIFNKPHAWPLEYPWLNLGARYAEGEQCPQADWARIGDCRR
eukprot:1161764-Pelagomonas_calceolata.AAC.2